MLFGSLGVEEIREGVSIPGNPNCPRLLHFRLGNLRDRIEMEGNYVWHKTGY
jgi:hypothetical protein